MKLLYSTTSPYARIARIALAEKGFGGDVSDAQAKRGDLVSAATPGGRGAVALDPLLTDPWNDDPALLAANASARVPALVLDGGLAITESLLIVLWLETQHPTPTLLDADPDRTIAQAGIAMGAIDAAAAIVITRRSAPGFDEMPVGLRRRRAIAEALRRLEADPPALGEGDIAASLAVITAVVLRDYIAFRFAGQSWLPATPRLDALVARAARRRSFAASAPREMPKR